MIKNVLKYRKIILGIMLSLGLFFCSENVFALDPGTDKSCTYHFSDSINISVGNTVESIPVEADVTFVEDANGQIKIWDGKEYTDSYVINNQYIFDLGYTPTETLKQIFGSGNNFHCPDNPYIARTPFTTSGFAGEYLISIENSNPMLTMEGEFIRPNVTLKSSAIALRECTQSEIDDIKNQASLLRNQYLDGVYDEKAAILQSRAEATFLYDGADVYENICKGFETYNSFSDGNHMFEDAIPKYEAALDDYIHKTYPFCTNLDDILFGFGKNGDMGSYTEFYFNQYRRKLESLLKRCITKINNLTEEEKQEKRDELAERVEGAKIEAEKISQEYKAEYEAFCSQITSIDFLGGNVDNTCEGLLGNDLLDLIKTIYGYIKIAAPILLIIFGTIDFGAAVISGDKDALGKAFNKFIKRALICAAIFIVPYILEWLLKNAELPGGTPLIEDPMCGIK